MTQYSWSIGSVIALASIGWMGCSSSNAGPRVGDSYPDPNNPNGPEGRIESIAKRDAYTELTISYPAAWSCPTNGPAFETPVSTQSDPSALGDGRLKSSNLQGLVALRRPALKTDVANSLANAKSNIESAKCNGRTEMVCLDSNGQPVSQSNCRGPVYSDAGMVNSAPESQGAKQHSTTNNQIANVDEADFVKNDGNTIYVLSSDGLNVIDAWPAAQTHKVAKISLPGEPRRLFLEQDRLVVFTRMQGDAMPGAQGSNPSAQGCTYGYDCRFQSEGGHTMAVVFDVSTPANPVERMRYEFSGAFAASRRVGNTVYTVVDDTGATQVPGVDMSLKADSYEQLQREYAARAAENARLVDSAPDELFLPWIRTISPDGKTITSGLSDPGFAAQAANGARFISLIAFDLSVLNPPTRSIVASDPGYVYASSTALYLAVDRSNQPEPYNYSYYPRQAVDTVVHKFALSGVETSYRGSAVLPGHILNQFAMDEHKGVLRVASTKGWVPDPSVSSSLSVVAETNGELAIVGRIDGIAPTEDIRSVRFDGDRGFVVTFKKTDPLFVFDLSEPKSPKLKGELKIPGFSTYMHPLDENHLLAVGFDADDHGDFAFFNGIQIQLFDVTDLASPKAMHKLSIGTRGSASEALTNHLAFNYFPAKKMLAMPMTVCEGGGEGNFGDKMTFSGLMAFDISLDTGIKERGRQPFVDPSATSLDSGSCNQWWTNAKSLVKRSVFMDDFVYGISDTHLKVSALDDMSKVLQTLSLSGK